MHISQLVEIQSAMPAGSRIAPYDESLRLYRLLPRAEPAVIPNGGHAAAMSPLFREAVGDFLSRHGQPDAA